MTYKITIDAAFLRKPTSPRRGVLKVRPFQLMARDAERATDKAIAHTAYARNRLGAVADLVMVASVYEVRGKRKDQRLVRIWTLWSGPFKPSKCPTNARRVAHHHATFRGDLIDD